MKKSILWLGLVLLFIPGLSFGSEIKVGYGADRYSMADHYITFCLRCPNAWVTEPPVKLGDDCTAHPGLLESWEYDNGVYRLHLRPGITFSDGKPFDAQAMVESLRLYSKNRSDFLQIEPESLKVIDDKTLEFCSKQKHVHVIENMTHPHVAMYSPGSDPTKAPVGTGPYKLKEYKRDSHLQLVRNPDYWGEPSPNEKVSFRFIPDAQTRMMALLNGEVDIIHPVQTQTLLSLPKDGNYKIVASKQSKYVALMANIHGAPPFDTLKDINVRRALAYAVDRQTVAEVMFLGKARPAKALLPPWFWNIGDDFVEGYNFDPAKSEELLEASGWKTGANGIREKDGKRLKLLLVSGWPNASELKPLPEMLQQMFRKIGVELELIQTDDSGVYYDTYFSPGQADLYLEMGANTNADPTFLMYVLHHTQTPWLNYGYKWCVVGEDFDRAIDAARESTDPEVVRNGLRAATKFLIDDMCVDIPIVFAPDFYLVGKHIEFTPALHEYYTNYGNAIKK